jgi:hypothetical protein
MAAEEVGVALVNCMPADEVVRASAVGNEGPA